MPTKYMMMFAALAVVAGCGPEKGSTGDASEDGSDGTFGGSVSTADVPTGAEAGGVSDSVSASAAATSDGPPDAGQTTDAEDPAGGGQTTDGGETGNDEPAEPPAACVGVDHDACFPAAIEACLGPARWDVTPECVAAVTACYPIGTQVLAASDVIVFCAAEMDGICISEAQPGCGETFCGCTAGAFPFDWNNCWHLTLLACRPEVDSDCDEVLDGCYPGGTVPTFEACQQEVMETVGIGCDCPMCSIHEECEAALDACMEG